jgi:hypothetical protein
MVACSRGRYPQPQAWALQPLGKEGLLEHGARNSTMGAPLTDTAWEKQLPKTAQTRWNRWEARLASWWEEW